LGERYYYLNDYSTAITLFEKAASIPDNDYKKDGSVSIYNTMGLAYMNLNQIGDAEESYLKGLAIANERGIKVWQGILSGNLGNIYIKNGEVEKGRAMLRQDIKFSLARGARNPAAGALLRLAELSVQENNISEAEVLVDSALLLFKGKINNYRKSALYPTLSKINQSKGEWKEATMYLDSALRIKEDLLKTKVPIIENRFGKR
jgi:tetratricopeptide (TPR) repeat protein